VLKTSNLPAVFIVMGNGNLELRNISIDGSGVQATNLIASDVAGSSNHYSIALNNCTVTGLACNALFYANRSMVADSVVIRNSRFSGNKMDHIVMKDETDDKGYYNAEKIVLDKNIFTNEKGALLNVYRGGNDESTLGPQLLVTGNHFTNCNVEGEASFVQLTGVQKTRFINNSFKDCYSGKKLFIYKDTVRADHLLEKNTIESSGEIQANAFVKTRDNTIK